MQTITSLELQIIALEKNYAKAVAEQNKNVNLFALQNLIKKRKKELQDLKNHEWLAR